MSPRRGDSDGRMAHIGDVLGPALEKIGPKALWTDARIRRVWPAIVGADVAAHVRPTRLRGTSLLVYVSSDAWATEFRYLSEVVMQKLNERLGEVVVTEITVAKRRPDGRL
jgi:predicted nucleic acid-binding Zn ribbon protein